MIISEQVENNRIRHYSDSGFRIRQNETSVVYDDAVDVLPCKYTYSETEELVTVPAEDATEADYQAALARLGVQ